MSGVTPSDPGKRRSPEEIAAALAVVAACGGNVAEASRQTGIPERTLLRYAHKSATLETKPLTLENRTERLARALPAAKADLAAKMERLANNCIKAITPKKMKTADLRALTWSAAVAIDKMRLLRDEGPPPSEADKTIAESMRRAAEAMVAMAHAAGQALTVEQAMTRMREIQLRGSDLASERVQ